MLILFIINHIYHTLKKIHFLNFKNFFSEKWRYHFKIRYHFKLITVHLAVMKNNQNIVELLLTNEKNDANICEQIKEVERYFC